MRKLLVVGGAGFVGGHIVHLARGRWDVVVLDKEARPGIEPARFRAVDVTDRQEVLAVLAEEAPAAVINVAAISNIDFAEKNPELARQVNVLAAGYAAEGCRRAGARYIYFSSDAVFAGTADGYAEEDEPAPVNLYGRTKAEAERVVLRENPDTVVIRISLVLGFPLTGGNSFYVPLEESLKRGEEVAVPAEEIRTPVDVRTLAEVVLELAAGDYRGILHIGATDSVNRYELTRRIARAMGFNPALVKPKPAALAGPDRAPRHRNGIIRVAKAQRILQTRLAGVDEFVRRSAEGRPGSRR